MSSARAAESVNPSRVAAFRLSRHHLTRRAPSRALIPAARDMAGAQAQVLSAAQISLWARVSGLLAADVDAAIQDRTLVRAWCMRRTLHLLPSEDLVIFVRGSARRAEREIRWVRRKGVPDRVLEGLIDAALEALDQPRTRRELAERVSRTLGIRQRTFTGGGWGNRAEVPAVAAGGLTFPMVYLLHLVGARGVVCSGPGRGNEPTFVRADAWIPRWRDVPGDVAEQQLLRRYLRAFGPATPSDFAAWVGMPLRDAREIWERERSNLAPVRVDRTAAAVLRDDLRSLRRAEVTHPLVRLLPYFDAFLLGHREREHLVATQDRKKVYRAQGWVAPVLLVDGRAAGVWSLTRDGDRLRIGVEKFGPLSRGIAAAVREEARDLGRFLGAAGVDVRIA